ncbi:MAG: hypothetical protein J7604_21050 [Sporocytophaga sp.]|uniref:Imm7 family immunity protein n=1 Tax=Sporocytophaga sp. TaxID=2231183 RepID=UPI001B016BC4|nr:Imm7 family immunity protein [Sporocytophaga sp.]MBO9702713.1 hypothetical protein [Sporocytophaga sp.]
MIQYSGWAIIRESYNEEGEDENKLRELVQEIRKKMIEIKTCNEFLDQRYMNGAIHLTIQGNHNHRNNQLIDFFIWVASIAIGSYGLLYVHDDEDDRGNHNKFMVFRMAKGKVNELEDIFLSPYYPTVEDEKRS